MKKNTIIYAAALCIITLFSCNQKPAETKQEELKNDVVLTELSIVKLALDTAKSDIHRYDDACRDFFNDSVPIRAFTVRAADLFEALGMPVAYYDSVKYQHARVYLGLDAYKHFKIFFTPVADANLDPGVMSPGKDIILQGLPGDGKAKYVLDLNAPCPNTCDTQSPLYQPN